MPNVDRGGLFCFFAPFNCWTRFRHPATKCFNLIAKRIRRFLSLAIDFEVKDVVSLIIPDHVVNLLGLDAFIQIEIRVGDSLFSHNLVANFLTGRIDKQAGALSKRIQRFFC